MILHWLAKPGEAGTLKNKCLDYKGRLWAKTGTLKDVKALSGYIKTISGKTYAFSILCNNGPGSERCWQTIEDILKILDKY